MPMVASQLAPLEGAAVARDLKRKSDCHNTQESLSALCTLPFTGTGDYCYCNSAVFGMPGMKTCHLLASWSNGRLSGH